MKASPRPSKAGQGRGASAKVLDLGSLGFKVWRLGFRV